MSLLRPWRRLARSLQVRAYLADLESKIAHLEHELDEVQAELTYFRRQVRRTQVPRDLEAEGPLDGVSPRQSGHSKAVSMKDV